MEEEKEEEDEEEMAVEVEREEFREVPRINLASSGPRASRRLAICSCVRLVT